MIYIVALGVGLKCPRKIHLNTQCGRGDNGRVIFCLSLPVAGDMYRHSVYEGGLQLA